MSPDTIAQIANVALLPIAGLLWRISTQLAAMNATMAAQDERIERLEQRCEKRTC